MVREGAVTLQEESSGAGSYGQKSLGQKSFGQKVLWAKIVRAKLVWTNGPLDKTHLDKRAFAEMVL